VHDHWEEVYLLSGDLIVGNDAKGQGGESFASPTYACRPPGVHHGPFKSVKGCLLFEMHYYDESKKNSPIDETRRFPISSPIPISLQRPPSNSASSRAKDWMCRWS